MILPCQASSNDVYILDLKNGYPFATALSIACTTTPMGSTSPASAVAVYILCS